MADVKLFNIVADIIDNVTTSGTDLTPTPSQNSRKAPPTLSDLLDHRKRETKAEMNCVQIGTIRSFYPDTQTADITINVLRVLKNQRGVAENQMTDTYVKYPVLINCPVVVLAGGDAVMTFPIATGDTCLVLFCDRSIDSWFSTGQVTIPSSDRVHSLSDGVALVGIGSLATSLPLYNTDAVEVRTRGILPKMTTPILNVHGAIGMADMILPPTAPVAGCFYWNPLLNNWYGWKIVAYAPITGLPIYGWVAFT